jgi:hypothetical protein
MKRSRTPEAFPPFIAMLLAFAIAYRPIETTFIAPAMAQSSTETSPQAIPDQAVETKDLAWWALLLPLSGGLLWWGLMRSQSTPEIAPAPVAAIDPVTPPPTPRASVVSEATIPLLEERLVVDFHRRKIGEVVVRKEVDICIVEVPVRRERLIVEQISPTYEQLAVVDLGSACTEETHLSNGQFPQSLQASFISANAAVEFLQSIEGHSNLGRATAPISLVLADESLRSAYQKWSEQHEG